MKDENDADIIEGIGLTKVLLAVMGLSILSFMTDASLGGGVVLSGFSLGIDPRDFFASLFVSSLLFIFFWAVVSKKFRSDIRYSNAISWFMTFAFVIFSTLSFLIGSQQLFIFITVPLFNFLSFTLFAFTTRSVSKTAMYPQRGKYVSIGVSAGLALSSLAIFLGEQSGEFSPYITMGVTIALALVPFWLILIGWYPLRRKGVKYIGSQEEDILRLASKSFRFAILAASLFLIGSGAAHGVLVSQVEDFDKASRWVSYLFTIPLILIITGISDKVGRYALLIGAVSMNTVSQFLAYSGSAAQIVSTFEIAGYYLALVFIILKLSEELGPRNWKLYGIAWGVIFSADFLGALISVTLTLNTIFETIFSLLMMLISVVIIFFTPKYLESDLEIKGILILEDEKLITKKGKGIEEVKDILLNPKIGEAEHIELEGGEKVVLTKYGNYTTAALVNLHTTSLVEKLQKFAEEVSKMEGVEDISSSLISDIFGEITDDEGSDVKFMEM